MNEFHLARSEAERIASENGVPCYPARDPVLGIRTPQLAEAFARCGLACGIASKCNPFGISPAAYYDDNGTMVCIRYPVPFRKNWLPEVHAEIAKSRV